MTLGPHIGPSDPSVFRKVKINSFAGTRRVVGVKIGEITYFEPLVRTSVKGSWVLLICSRGQLGGGKFFFSPGRPDPQSVRFVQFIERRPFLDTFGGPCALEPHSNGTLKRRKTFQSVATLRLWVPRVNWRILIQQFFEINERMVSGTVTELSRPHKFPLRVFRRKAQS